MGVRRAMEMVLAEANKEEGPIFTYGPLIHNKQVMDLLESKGVTSIEDVSKLEDGTILIRAHGIPPDKRKMLKSCGIRILDATCPRVAKVQAIIRYHTKKGFTAVIAGDRNHAEVIGLLGYGNGQAHVISAPEDVSNLPEMNKVLLVAQTTQDEQNFEEIKSEIKKRFPDALVIDTICDATHHRQAEIRSFSGQVDGVVVVGGYHSGNTRRLAEVSQAAGLPTFHIETEEELEKEKLSSMEVIGVTAGASTPNWMIRNVVRKIESVRSSKEGILGRGILRIIKSLFLSNFIVALGALALAFSAMIISGRNPDYIHPSLAFFYIYAMHIFNRFLDKGASIYNDPERAHFNKRNKALLIFSGVASMIGALTLSYFISPTVLFVMVGFSLLGIIYSIPIVPVSRRHLWKYTKIKDIPGSKTLSEALGWSVVIALIPLIEPVQAEWTASIVSFVFVFSLVYVRSALFDIFQFQGDLIVGAETLPVSIGIKRTIVVLKEVIISAGFLILGAGLFGFVGVVCFLLLLCFITSFLSILAYEKRWLLPGKRLEGLVEANLYFAGLLALFWHLLS